MTGSSSSEKPSGTLLGTLTTLAVDAGRGGLRFERTYNLSIWAGQTVRIQFRGTNDITLPTSFRVDDVSVSRTNHHLGPGFFRRSQVFLL